MKIVPVCLGGFAPSRRPPLATTIGWRDLARGSALCLGTVALLVLLVAAVGPRQTPTPETQTAAIAAASPLGKFGR